MNDDPPSPLTENKIQVVEVGGGSRYDSAEIGGVMTSLVWVFNKSPLTERTRWVSPAAPVTVSERMEFLTFFSLRVGRESRTVIC